jgi:hypothetical protein
VGVRVGVRVVGGGLWVQDFGSEISVSGVEFQSWFLNSGVEFRV